MKMIFTRFLKDESGATAIEYGLLAALISVVIIGAVKVAGTNLSNKFTQIANQVLNNLKAPDILALQEVQDNDGAELSSVTSASQTLQKLVDTINAAATAAAVAP